MSLRTIAFSLFSFLLGATLFAVEMPVTRSAQSSLNKIEDRTRDKEAIRAHIDKIFQAYMRRDCETIRATHSSDWLGFTGSATSIVRGLDEYMSSSAPNCRNDSPAPRGISDYKITDIDFLFQGDVALVPYIADVTYGRENPFKGKLRSLDIYAKRNGDWIQVGSNIGPHPDMIQAQITQAQRLRQLNADELAKVLKVRENVWRAYFSNDRATLEKLVSPGRIASGGSDDSWANRAGVLSRAEEFAKAGGKLTRLEFPNTEVQAYGNVVILYSTYLYETAFAAKKTTNSGRATQVFLIRDSDIVSSGWHWDFGQRPVPSARPDEIIQDGCLNPDSLECAQ